MKKIAQLGMLLSIIALSILSACGGGGGGAGNSPAVLTKATLKLITSGTGTIHGIDVTVSLAEGVTVKSSNPPYADTDAVTLSEIATGATITALYTAATGSMPGTVRLMVASAGGFPTGEFCRVNGDIASGHAPLENDFSLIHFTAWDADGKAINGLTHQITADMQ